MFQQKNSGFKWGILRFGIIGLLLVMAGFSWYHLVAKTAQKPSFLNRTAQASINVDLVLKKSYICGTEEEQKVNKSFASTDEVMKEYQDWNLESHQGNTFVFKKKIQDLAPVCKEKGYFGLSDHSVLTLFEGPPDEKKVIQTFFQIDTQKIESSLPGELGYLQKGIRIKDLGEYNSILSSYEEYQDSGNSPQQDVQTKDSAH